MHASLHDVGTLKVTFKQLRRVRHGGCNTFLAILNSLPDTLSIRSVHFGDLDAVGGNP